ncbi:hydrogen peroxide-inducible genes activator [Microvirga sp. W0021]|uniref:Hydrogen peroxide-inducible genes activator n=1 Tax=Hohaiivirga grylli TaxID=3133970 RepID=A0ABV0BI02_9HYPH
MITLRHLRYFEALSRHNNFSRAAEECAVTQPAMSIQIQEFENILGIPLVERRRGAAELTAVGIEVAKKAKDILLSVHDLQDYVATAGGYLQGKLSLGIIPTLAPYLLAQLLPAIRTSFPELELSIYEAHTEKLYEELTTGRLDSILISTPVDQEGVQSIDLFEDGFVLAICSNAELSKEPIISSQSLSDIDVLLLDEGHCLRDQALSFCNTSTKRIREQYGATSLATIIQLIVNCQGATFLPEIAIPAELKDPSRLILRRFSDIKPSRKVNLAWRTSSPRKEEFETLGHVIAHVGSEAVAKGRQIMARNGG